MTELADQPIDTAAQITNDVEAKLAAVAKSLREASASALDLSEDASAALSTAAAEVVRVAEVLRQNARDAGRQVAHEVQEHPLASIAAALAAVGAVAGMIVMARRVGKAT